MSGQCYKLHPCLVLIKIISVTTSKCLHSCQKQNSRRKLAGEALERLKTIRNIVALFCACEVTSSTLSSARAGVIPVCVPGAQSSLQQPGCPSQHISHPWSSTHSSSQSREPRDLWIWQGQTLLPGLKCRGQTGQSLKSHSGSSGMGNPEPGGNQELKHFVHRALR